VAVEKGSGVDLRIQRGIGKANLVTERRVGEKLLV